MNKKYYITIFASLFFAFLLGLFIYTEVIDNNSVDKYYYVETKDLKQTQEQEVLDKYGTEGLLKVDTTEQQNVETPSFSVSILDVGQASCAVFECDGHYMVFDGGDRDTSSFVVSYLMNTLTIHNIDYVIASHYDSDHIAGLIGILNKFNVSYVFGPDYTADTKIFNSFYNAANTVGGINVPTVGQTYELGSATFTFVSPIHQYTDENSNSLGIRVDYGSTSYLIMGDATTETEIDSVYAGYISPVDILVLNHHGSASSSSDEFLQATNPQAILISVGKDNEYGHPADSVMARLPECLIYRTDINGTITLSSDGETIDISTEK